MTPIIAIYHHPQECGDPFLAIISQQTGEILESVTIPENYYDSGIEMITSTIPVRTFTEHICQALHEPTLEIVRPKSQFGVHPRDHKFRPIKVTITKYDPDILPTWDADILVEEYIEKTQFKYSSSKDTFKQTMDAQGFDLSSWPYHKRKRTPLMEFLRSVLSSYKNYHLVNLIQIG